MSLGHQPRYNPTKLFVGSVRNKEQTGLWALNPDRVIWSAFKSQTLYNIKLHIKEYIFFSVLFYNILEAFKIKTILHL